MRFDENLLCHFANRRSNEDILAYPGVNKVYVMSKAILQGIVVACQSVSTILVTRSFSHIEIIEYKARLVRNLARFSLSLFKREVFTVNKKIMLDIS